MSTPSNVLPPFLEPKFPGQRWKESVGRWWEGQGSYSCPLASGWCRPGGLREAGAGGGRKLLFIFLTMGVEVGVLFSSGKEWATNCFPPVPGVRSPESNFSLKYQNTEVGGNSCHHHQRPVHRPEVPIPWDSLHAESGASGGKGPKGTHSQGWKVLYKTWLGITRLSPFNRCLGRPCCPSRATNIPV